MLNRLQELFESLEKREVKYVVIGGIAAILHGVPRATLDLDMLIEASRENADRMLAAFSDAGLGTAVLLDADELLANEITVFKDRVRIDVQTSTPGLEFSQAWKNRVGMSYAGQSFFVVSKEDLVASKLGAGRPKDLEDVRLLELPE
jgi:hypothetical protein